MPGEPPTSTSNKSSGKVKRISIPRVQSSTDTAEFQSQMSQSGSTPLQPMALHYVSLRSDIDDSAIPPTVHSRLLDLFQQIQKEFEMVCMENIGCKKYYLISSSIVIYSFFFLHFFITFICTYICPHLQCRKKSTH